jgi:hypothetical protein
VLLVNELPPATSDMSLVQQPVTTVLGPGNTGGHSAVPSQPKSNQSRRRIMKKGYVALGGASGSDRSDRSDGSDRRIPNVTL